MTPKMIPFAILALLMCALTPLTGCSPSEPEAGTRSVPAPAEPALDQKDDDENDDDEGEPGDSRPGDARPDMDKDEADDKDKDDDEDDDNDEPDAEDILEMAWERWEDLKDYRCTMRTWNRIGDVTDDKTIEFTYRRPGMARSHVLEGDNKGGVVTRDAEGRLRGRKGGALSLIVLTLKEDDDRIRNIRGKKFYEADLGTMLGEFRDGEDKDWEITRLPDEDFKGQPCYQIEMKWADPASAVTSDTLLIGRETLVIHKRIQYEGETKVNDATYWDYLFDQGFEDSLFTQ